MVFKWGRPKGSKLSEAHKAKIKAGVRAAYLRKLAEEKERSGV
jgi:hypothetical protein